MVNRFFRGGESVVECACDYMIPLLVFSGRAFVIVEWCLRGCRSASRVCSSAGTALCVGWSGDRSQFGCQCNVS